MHPRFSHICVQSWYKFVIVIVIVCETSLGLISF